MTTDLHHWIAALSPENYCAPRQRGAVRALLNSSAGKEQARVLAAAVPVEPHGSSILPVEQFTLVYDCLDDSLEAIYFTLLEAIQQRAGWEVVMLADTIHAAAGSGFSVELGRKGVTAQHEATRLIGDAQGLVRSMLSAVSEIRQLQARFRLHEQHRSSEDDATRAALLSLKQRWLDETEAGRRAQSLNRTVERPFLGTFLEPPSSHSTQDSQDSSLSLSMGVLRGIEKEFQHWLVEDERELRLRIDLGRQQLRTQLETLKLQARWLHPYLRVAEQLTASSSSSPALVTAFNTALFEVTLLALQPLEVSQFVQRGDLPEWMERYPHRDYFSVVVVELFFRSAPLRVGGSSHAHRGKVEISCTSYALHQAELEMLRRQYERDELGELMRHLGVTIPANLEDLLLDLDENAAEPPRVPSRTTEEDSNPFTALFSLLASFLRWLSALVRPGAARTGLEPDSEIEQRLRQHAAVHGQRQCQQLYAQLKSSLGLVLSEPERLAV